MIVYLLKSASCLALLLFFYHLILEKEKMHNFNRFYLLGSILFSFLAPLATITIVTSPEVIASSVQDINPQVFINETTPIIIEETINYTQLFFIIYIIISVFFLFRFSRNLFKIIKKISNNKKIIQAKATLVLVDDEILPHTFWDFIFINKNDYKIGKIEDELFTHELTHVTQKHTLDILIIEILKIVFWFNPIFYFLKKTIQLNHEFLADTNVITNHKNISEYQYLLLNKTSWNNEYYLASNLNYLLTKKRLQMMTKQSSKTKMILKKLAVIPLLVGFVFLFAERVEAQEKQEIIETIYEQESSKSNELSSSEIYKEYFYKNGFITLKDKKGKKISKKYSELTEEEKKNVPPPPPLKTKKKTPSKKIIEDLKDGKKYALWIDGKVVKNTVLNNYKNSDFSSYFVSFVHKNARSKRFPQNYQASLSTNKYFKSENDKRVKKFKEYLESTYEVEEIKETPKKENIGSKSYKETSSKQSISSNISLNNIQLKLGKTYNSTLVKYNDLAKKYNQIPIEKRTINLKDLNKLETYYRQLTKSQKEIAQPFPECYLPKKISIFLKKNNEIIINNKVSSINNLKNTLESLSIKLMSDNLIIFIEDKTKLNQLTKVRAILREYGITNLKVNNISESKENKGKYDVNSYRKLYKIYQNKRKQKPHFVKSSQSRQKDLKEQFSLLGSLYFKLSKENKRKVKKPIHPHHPYLKLMKNNNVFYKLRKDLTEEDKLLIPPPPPPPNASKEEILKAKKAYKAWKKRTGNGFPVPPPPLRNHLDQVIKMAKKGATFYYEGKRINSDKAISLLKKNNKLNIHSKSTNNSNYEVWISKKPFVKEIKK